MTEDLAHWKMQARAMAQAADTEKAEAKHWRARAEAAESGRPANAPTCPACKGKGWCSPDDAEQGIQVNGELYGAGYELGKRVGAEAAEQQRRQLAGLFCEAHGFDQLQPDVYCPMCMAVHADDERRAAEQQLQALHLHVKTATEDIAAALRESDESEIGGGGRWIGGQTYRRIRGWLASLTQPGAAGQESMLPAHGFGGHAVPGCDTD